MPLANEYVKIKSYRELIPLGPYKYDFGAILWKLPFVGGNYDDRGQYKM